MVDPAGLDAWFVREVLPLEGVLMRFLRRNLRSETDLRDLRQDVYARAYEAAAAGLPVHTKAFIFTIGRNLIVDRVRRSRVVSIELVANLERGDLGVDLVTPERNVLAMDELRRLQAGLDRLPPRCREVVKLRKIEGHSQRDVARLMAISEDTVERQLAHGMRALADFMLGGSGAIVRPAASRQRPARHE